MMTITLEPPAPFLNSNGREHWRVKAKLTATWRAAAAEAAYELGPVTFTRARIECHYRFADNRRREVSNLQPTSKALVDGLVDAGLLIDDSDEFVVGPDNRRIRPNGPPLVRIKIREIAA